MTERITRQWLAAALALVVAVPAHAGDADDVVQRIRQAQDALTDWQLDDAAAIAQELERKLPDVPPVQALVGAVKFHQGDFDGAVRLLQRAAEGGEQSSLLPLAQSTLKETAGSVSSSSEHFVFRTPPGKDELLAPIALEKLEQAYAAITTQLDYRPKHKIAVDVLHDARGLASVSTLTVKEIETTGTIALCKYNRLMITSPKALARGYSWIDTLSHELVHLVVSEKSRNNTPVWLHEGLAKYNESRWRGKPGLALEPASENLLASAFKKGTLITFEQMHPSMAKLPSQHDAALAFAEVFTVVEMLAQQQAPQGPKPDVAILDALAAGKGMDDALKAGAGVDLQGLQARWRAYLKKRPFRLVPGAEPEVLTFVKDARKGAATSEKQEDEGAVEEARKHGAAATDGQRWVRLGNLLREKRRLKAATVEYEKAVAKIGTASPILHNRLAGVYVEIGELDRAKKLLADSVAVFPDDPQTHVLLGRVALLGNDWQEARSQYERATWEAPFNPEIHMALFKVAEATKDDALKQRATAAMGLILGHAKSSSAVPARAADNEPHGTLSVSSEPWGRVYIDGADTGATTPIVDFPLKPGPHIVRVVDPFGKEAAQEIAIVVNQGTRVPLTLQQMSQAERDQWIAKEEALGRPAIAPPPPKKPRPVPAPSDAPPPPWAIEDEDVER